MHCSKTRKRSCPSCGHASKNTLFTQTFSGLSSGSLYESFDLVVCQACGLAYADGIPDQAAFDAYYENMSKYEYVHREGVQTDSDMQRFRSVVDMVGPHLTKQSSVLDVGCATGGLLAEFSRRGFKELRGIDPSLACVDAVKRLYGIQVSSGRIRDLPQLGERFDLVVLTGVLEHLEDLKGSMDFLKSVIDNEGMLYVELPDASRYHTVFSAPYQLISIEHVNYFSKTSLITFMARHGLAPVFVEEVLRPLSAKAMEPTLAGLFRRCQPEQVPALVRDETTEAKIQLYLGQSAELEKVIKAKIGALVDAGKPFYVWGVGTHTQRLLTTSRLGEGKIRAFVDSNVRYQGKTIHGVNIVAPSAIAEPELPILISSQTAEDDIARQITATLRLPNTVVKLYS